MTRRIVLAGLLALSTSVALAVPASAAAQRVDFRCQGNAFGKTATLTLRQVVDGWAPARVAPGGPLRVVLTPAPNRVPTSVSGHRVDDIRDVALTVPVPANAEFVNAWLDGGRGLGGAPWISRAGRAVVLHIPGPLRGGTEFQFPRLTLDLKAGRSGTIATRLGGTSYANAGLTFTTSAQARNRPARIATSCYPTPNPMLTGTRIT